MFGGRSFMVPEQLAVCAARDGSVSVRVERECSPEALGDLVGLDVGLGHQDRSDGSSDQRDPQTGLTLTSNLEDYRIPQLGDTPEITIHFHEPGWEHVPGGGVGLGEVATISPAASVGNAIFNATGFRPTVLPVRPDRLLEGLR